MAESSMKGKTHSHNTLNFLLRVQCVSNTYLNPRSPIRAGLFRWPPPVECMQATPSIRENGWGSGGLLASQQEHTANGA